MKYLVLSSHQHGRHIGSTEIEVWKHLNVGEDSVQLVLQHPDIRLNEHARSPGLVVLKVPLIPMLNWLILNVIMVISLCRTKATVLFCSHRTILAASLLKQINRVDKVIIDLRSVPVVPGRILATLEQIELALALTLGQYDGLTTITSGTLAQLRAEYHLRLVPTCIWGSGVDFDFFKPAADRPGGFNGRATGLILMYHGTIARDRGLQELVEAIGLVSGRVNVRLIIVGDGPYSKRLRAYSRDLEATGRVEFRSPVHYVDVPFLLDEADVGALPFPALPKWFHQMPLKVLEYIAMEKMTLATDIPSHRGMGPGVFIVRDNKPETLAAGIAKIAELPSVERRRLARLSKTEISMSSWRRQAEKIKKFVETEVLAS